MKLKTISKRGPAENQPENAVFTVEAMPDQLRRILVPVDFSESSRQALNYAVYFARKFDAEIFLLHVVEPIPPPAPDFAMGDGLANETKLVDLATAELAKWREAIDAGVAVRTEVEIGSAHREIIRLAVENEIDLIVIGMRGHSGLAHFLFGSTAEQVVRHAFCPVTVIKDAAPPVRVDSNEMRAAAPLELASQPALA